MAPTLLDLPVEITDCIFQHLEIDHLLAVRLTCRTLRIRSLFVYSTKCFSTLRTSLTRRSLKRMERVGKTEYLRAAVRSVMFFVVRDPATAPRWRRQHSGRISKEEPRLELLKRALQTLPKQMNIIVYDDSTELERAYYDHYLSRSDVTAIALHMIAELDLEPASLRFTGFIGVLPPMQLKRLSFVSLRSARLKRSLSHLRVLDIKCGINVHMSRWFRELLSVTPNLQVLRIFSSTDHYQRVLEPLEDKTKSPQLMRLSLTGFMLLSNCLTNVASQVRRTLTQLELHNAEVRGQIWPTIFRSWIGAFDSLRTLNVSFLVHGHPDCTNVAFPLIQDNPIFCETERFQIEKYISADRALRRLDYSGLRINRALAKLADSCYNLKRCKDSKVPELRGKLFMIPAEETYTSTGFKTFSQIVAEGVELIRVPARRLTYDQIRGWHVA